MSDDDVVLLRDDYWPEIPRNLQERIEEGVGRISTVRDSISEDARVRRMPPVAVMPDAVSPDGGQTIVHALGGLWPAWGRGTEIGVLSAVGPSLCSDEGVVRAILVHEFAHCFQAATVLVNHFERGEPIDFLRGDPMDEVRERAMLAAAGDWFGPDDLELMHSRDERMRSTTEEVERLVSQGALIGRQMPAAEQTTYAIPQEWADHIRELRHSRPQS